MTDDAESEPDAFPVRWTTAVIIGLVGFVALCAAVIWLGFPSVRAADRPPPARFSGPGLETSPAADYRADLVRREALLAGAGGRMPISQAMKQVVRRGALAPETGQ